MVGEVGKLPRFTTSCIIISFVGYVSIPLLRIVSDRIGFGSDCNKKCRIGSDRIEVFRVGSDSDSDYDFSSRIGFVCRSDRIAQHY